MPYLGNTPTTQSFISGTDYFNGTGAQTAFTLSRTVASVNDIQAVVNNVVQVPNDAYTISGTTITFTSAPSAGTQNVYVRYLSTTTQAITPSQNTVSWSTLDTNTQQDLGISFKNRIINGNMVIDQRNAGASVATSSGSGVSYCVDRFAGVYSVTSKFTLQQNAGATTPPSGFTNYLGVTSSAATSLGASDYYLLAQYIEGYNIADLGFGTSNAKTFTLSFWVRSSLTGTFGGALTNNGQTRNYAFSYTINAANTWEQKTITVVGDQAGTWNTTNSYGLTVYWSLGTGSTYSGTGGSWGSTVLLSTTGATSVVGTNGATFYLTGVMLEVGTQATTFTTAGGSYGAELALCQRYFQVVTDGTNGKMVSGGGGFYSSSVASCPTPLKVTMRTVPTISSNSGTNYWLIYNNSAGTTFNAFTGIMGEATADIAGVYVSGLSRTAGHYGYFATNNASAFLAYQAEL